MVGFSGEQQVLTVPVQDTFVALWKVFSGEQLVLRVPAQDMFIVWW